MRVRKSGGRGRGVLIVVMVPVRGRAICPPLAGHCGQHPRRRIDGSGGRALLVLPPWRLVRVSIIPLLPIIVLLSLVRTPIPWVIVAIPVPSLAEHRARQRLWWRHRARRASRHPQWGDARWRGL